jgi:hypothetical protein
MVYKGLTPRSRAAAGTGASRHLLEHEDSKEDPDVQDDPQSHRHAAGAEVPDAARTPPLSRC